MANGTYVLINDTRYDNHHGGLTVVRNLHAAMTARGWRCTGSLPVSATVKHLPRLRRALAAADLVIVNGEGSLHHDSRNTRRLLALCTRLQKHHPVAIINALWQDNDRASWHPILTACHAVYARDRRSQQQLHDIGIDAGYAPDLTFYDYPVIPAAAGSRFACTDSVRPDWTAWALAQCEASDDMDFITLFTRRLAYTRGSRDWSRRIKYALCPILATRLPGHVSPRYRSLAYAVNQTDDLLRRIASARAICVARYHALCFAIQQNVPFIAVASNAHKSEALLEEVGLQPSRHLYQIGDTTALRDALERAAENHHDIHDCMAAFTATARHHIDAMFDGITGHNARRSIPSAHTEDLS